MKILKQGDVIEVPVDDKLKVNITRSDVGYIIDLFTAKDELFINTYTVWDDDIDYVVDETYSIMDTKEDYEDEENS